jgi:hypothetical protein
MHGDCAVIVMAEIAHVHVNFANSVADQVINLLHLRGKRVTIVGISGKALGADESPLRLLTATLTLLPNSYGLPALPLAMHCTSGSCTE